MDHGTTLTNPPQGRLCALRATPLGGGAFGIPPARGLRLRAVYVHGHAVLAEAYRFDGSTGVLSFPAGAAGVVTVDVDYPPGVSSSNAGSRHS
jgi:hypothetical protein